MRNFALVSVLVCNLALVVPHAMDAPRVCRTSDAAAFRATADRYREHRDYAAAARWYEAAATSTAGCSDARDLMVHARSLVQAGAATAETGDYLRALTFVHEAQLRLRAIAAADRKGTAAQTYLEVANDLISAINIVAAASM